MHFNPRSPHGERQHPIRFIKSTDEIISIHAPRTGSDWSGADGLPAGEGFQSTLPARGATNHTAFNAYQPERFQSTLPARGATNVPDEAIDAIVISIHAPRTGSDPSAVHPASRCPISIHAPRTGSDTKEETPKGSTYGISIHAPRTGSDDKGYAVLLLMVNFNPRSPHGERRNVACVRIGFRLFQSTLPARGATNL